MVRLVAALLARRPEDRPPSADAVLAALGAGADVDLPWLGSRAPVDALVAAARAGRSIDVWGSPGSGRTRVLREAAATVHPEREVVELIPADRPMGSLAPIVGGLDGDAPMADAEGRLRDALARDVVVLADDFARLDRWTRALLERLRGIGSVLRVAAGADAVRLDGVAESDLRALFHGPDVVLHLREDAAHALFQRTGGIPGRVAEEVQAWVARGDARWDDGRLRVDRAAIESFAAGHSLVGGRVSDALEEPLDQLHAWVLLAGPSATTELLVAATGLPAWEIDVELGALEEAYAVRRLPSGRLQALTLPRALGRWTDDERAAAHRKLAAALPARAPDRLLHLAAAGDTDAIESAAVTFARSLLDTGAAGRALAALQYAIGEMRAAQADVSTTVLEELARAALLDGSGPALREARLSLERVGTSGAAVLTALVAAWDAAGERRYAEAAALVAGVHPLPDPDLDGWRLALPVRIVVATDLDEAERLIAALKVHPDSPVGRRRVEWLGHLRYRQDRLIESAELHERAARHESGAARRANALVNAGMAWRDGYQLDLSLAAFREARQLASGGRLAALEGHAVIVDRAVLYRLRHLREPDMELLTTLADPRLLAPAFLNEAAVAWRSGDNQTAERLAREAARYWDHPSTPHGWLVASALACAAGGHAAEAQALAALPQSPEPLYRAQVTRLLQVAGADVPDDPRVEIPPEHAERMLYVLGLGELWGGAIRS